MNKKKLMKEAKYALRWLPDRVYIQLYYFGAFHRICNLRNPQTYNEKLNWLKLYDRNPLYTKLVDKYEVKDYVSKAIGSEYVIPTLAVVGGGNFGQIDFESLPNQFVIKCTHDSEGLAIVKDKSKFDKEEAKRKIEKALKYNFYYIGREWPYKNVEPRIIVEPYLEDHTDGELRDYKFFCFNGEPKAMFIASDRSKGETKFDYYDLEFNHLDIIQHYPNAGNVRKPVNFDKMIELSKVLSKGFPHVRVDFYEVDGQVYFGELTFYHFSGFQPFIPEKWDKIFGDWLRLPKQ